VPSATASAAASHAGGPVRTAASSAFTDGLHAGLLYAAGAALTAAVCVAALLPRSPRRSGVTAAKQLTPASSRG
jgi:hypothetical protein